MKINKEHFENRVWDYTDKKGEKMYKLEKVNDMLSVYTDGWFEVFFETDTLERVGIICESDVRCSFKRYYTASYEYGWDGKKKTKKEFWKTLCTRGDYSTARALLLQEYKANKK